MKTTQNQKILNFLLLIALIGDLCAHLLENTICVYFFKGAFLSILFFYFELNKNQRKSKFSLAILGILISAIFLFNFSYPFESNPPELNFVGAMASQIISGFFLLHILTSLYPNKKITLTNDVKQMLIAAFLGLFFIFFFWEKIEFGYSLLIMVRLVQLALIVIYGFWRKHLHINISLGITFYFASAISSSFALYMGRFSLDYHLINLTLFASFYFIVDGIARSIRMKINQLNVRQV